MTSNYSVGGMALDHEPHKNRDLSLLLVTVLPAPRTMPGIWYEGRRDARERDKVSDLVELKVQ